MNFQSRQIAMNYSIMALVQMPVAIALTQKICPGNDMNFLDAIRQYQF